MAASARPSLGDLPPRDVSSTGVLSPTTSYSSNTKGSAPLVSKIATVLSTSYSDTEFRDALSLLDGRGVRNDAKTRRQVRSDLLKEVIDSNGAVIGEFGKVAEQLRRIRFTLDKLNSGYEDMKSRVAASHDETSATLSEAHSLTQQKGQVETKQQLLNAFKRHFVLTEDEVAALTMTSEPVDEPFFEALAKAKKISRDCEVLLGFEKQNLGLELMESTSTHINFGFQKLYKWVQREFKTLNLENPQMNPLIRRSLRVLAERPTLFGNCLNFFAEARERILTDSFYVALTGATSSSVEDPSVKPIDLTAHDPLRYVGDMLAWIHSATVSEREALEVLFVAEGEELAKGIRSGRDAEVWRLVAEEERDETGDFDALNALNDLVDKDMSGATRSLRQRIEQVIQTNEEVIPAYRLASLVNFYRVTFQKLLGDKANLIETTRALEIEALRQFRALVRDRIATLQAEFQQTPSDLGPPPFLQECLRQFDIVAKTFDASLSAAADREAEFESIVAEAFEPFITGCENMAEPMKLPGGAIFIANCKLTAVNCLKEFDFTQKRARQLQDDIETQAQRLVEDQYGFFLDGSGLRELLAAAKKPKEQHVAALSRDRLTQVSQQLDDFLPSALMDAEVRLKHLQDSSFSREITEKASIKFREDFEVLEEAIAGVDEISAVDEEDQDSLRAVFPRTSTEIGVLLS